MATLNPTYNGYIDNNALGSTTTPNSATTPPNPLTPTSAPDKNIQPTTLPTNIQPTTTPTGQPIAPAVVSSTAAKGDLGKIQNNLNTVKTAITAKATTPPATPTPPTPPVTPPSQTTQTNKTVTLADGKAYMVAPDGEIMSGPSSGQYQVGSNVNSYPNSELTNLVNPPAPKTVAGINVTSDTLSQQAFDKATKAADQITGIQNGSIPLTAGEQAQVDGLKAQFQAIIRQTQLANTNYQQGLQILGAQSGRERYTPEIHLGMITAAIQQGEQKIADLNSQMSAAVAQMEQGFKTNDINAIKASNDTFQAAATARTQYLQKMSEDAQKALVDQQNIDLATKKQALDELVASNTKSYQDKSLAIEKANLDEKSKNDYQTQLREWANTKINAFQSGLTIDSSGNVTSLGTNTNGQPVKPSDLPGVITSPTSGVSYFDPTQFSDSKQKAAAERVARAAGITVLSNSSDREAVTNLDTALARLSTLQTQFKDLAPSDFPGAKLGSKIGNLFGDVANISGLYTTDYQAKLDAYNTNRDQLFQQISAFAGSHPRVNTQELIAAANAMPKLDLTNMDVLKGGNEKLQLTRKYAYDALHEYDPKAILPFSGDKIYTTANDFQTDYGNINYADFLKSHGQNAASIPTEDRNATVTEKMAQFAQQHPDWDEASILKVFNI